MNKITLLLSISMLVLSACQKPEANEAPAKVTQAPLPAQAPTNQTSPTANIAHDPSAALSLLSDRTDTTPVDTVVASVQMSSQKNETSLIGAPTDTFSTSGKSVFMAIQTKGTAQKYTLSSKWMTSSGDILNEYAQTITQPGIADTMFSLSRPDGWPIGEYKVELSINGKLLKTQTFKFQ